MPINKENLVGGHGVEVVCWSCDNNSDEPKTLYMSKDKTHRTLLMAQILANAHDLGFEDHVITLFVSLYAN